MVQRESVWATARLTHHIDISSDSEVEQERDVVDGEEDEGVKATNERGSGVDDEDKDTKVKERDDATKNDTDFKVKTGDMERCDGGTSSGDSDSDGDSETEEDSDSDDSTDNDPPKPVYQPRSVRRSFTYLFTPSHSAPGALGGTPATLVPLSTQPTKPEPLDQGRVSPFTVRKLCAVHDFKCSLAFSHVFSEVLSFIVVLATGTQLEASSTKKEDFTIRPQPHQTDGCSECSYT